MAPMISAIKDFGHPIGADTLLRRTTFYLTLQSQHLGFSESIYLLTLCIAPLGMHIFAGAPAPVVLDGEHPPHWIDRIPLLNPTSIFWRYYTITLRVVRAEKHNAVEMGPANAVFWLGRKEKWNGSEAMIDATKELLNQEIANKPFEFDLLSASTFATLIITLQGIQALCELSSGIHLGGYALAVSLPNIFQPLAIAGLFRLLCSAWLRNAYYTNLDENKISKVMEALSKSKNDPSPTKRTNLPRRRYWLAVAVKIFFLSTAAALLAMALWYFHPNPRVRAGTASTLLINLLYVVFLLPTLIMTLFYTVRGETGTTIIPCINSVWYRVYTYMLFGFAGMVLIITALETSKTACGELTTYPEYLGFDKYLCS